MDNHREIVTLLHQAVAEPFLLWSERGEHGAARWPPALCDWARRLRTNYPLWALQPRAYAALNDTGLPTVYPLRALARSIGMDEGLLELSGQIPSLEKKGWLTMVIDNRRCNLCRQDRPSWLSDSW